MSALNPTKAHGRIAYWVLVFLLAALWGCATLKDAPKEPAPRDVEVVPPEPPKPEPPLPVNQFLKPKRGKPYQVCGKTYRPLLSAQGYEEKGIASWYGPSFQGRLTSCGDVFDMYKTWATP